MRVAAAAI